MATSYRTENKPYHRAMVEIRRSSSASPQERRNKRLRTKQTVLSRALRDAA